jgi:hypothetical protein
MQRCVASVVGSVGRACSALIVAAVFVLLAAGCGGRGYVERQPLDAFWEQHMLAGTSGNVWFNGRRFERLDSLPRAPYQEAKGNPFRATFTAEGLSVSYGQETAWFGILRRGGWGVEGGLLDRVELCTATLDVYGKIVGRTYPHFPFPPHRDTREDITLEVFLLYRPAAAAAVIVRKWVFEGIPSRDVAAELRAGLEYLPGSQSAVVTVTGLPEPFQEVMDLSSRMR